MWGLLIFIVITFAVVFFSCREQSNRGEVWGGSIGVGIVLGSIIFFFVSLFASGIPSETKVYDYSYNIYALSDKSAISGRIGYLGSARINENFRYYHIYNYEGGKKLGWVSASNSTIYEDEPDQPYIEVYVGKYDMGWWDYIFANINVGNKYYRVHIPPNSIIDGFYSIDMQ